MKFLIVFVLVAVAVCNIRVKLTRDDVKVISIACIEEAGASDADIEALKIYKATNTTESKCMHACMYKKFGSMNDEGKLVKEPAVEIAEIFIKDEDKLKLIVEVVEACAALKVSDDHCEAAFEYRRCLDTAYEAIAVAEDKV